MYMIQMIIVFRSKIILFKFFANYLEMVLIELYFLQ